eukprot:2141993-Prymnesium_polylepis.1
MQSQPDFFLVMAKKERAYSSMYMRSGSARIAAWDRQTRWEISSVFDWHLPTLTRPAVSRDAQSAPDATQVADLTSSRVAADQRCALRPRSRTRSSPRRAMCPRSHILIIAAIAVNSDKKSDGCEKVPRKCFSPTSSSQASAWRTFSAAAWTQPSCESGLFDEHARRA